MRKVISRVWRFIINGNSWDVPRIPRRTSQRQEHPYFCFVQSIPLLSGHSHRNYQFRICEARWSGFASLYGDTNTYRHTPIVSLWRLGLVLWCYEHRRLSCFVHPVTSAYHCLGTICEAFPFSILIVPRGITDILRGFIC